MFDLENLVIISFEVGIDCNLRDIHTKCPINCRRIDKNCIPMSDDEILTAMDDAIKLNFKGLFAFHFYNEPMLYIDRIKRIMEKRPDNRYLLWTNGTLLNSCIEDNDIIRDFELIVITCYSDERRGFYTKLQSYYGNVKINEESFDNRLQTYNDSKKNMLGCKHLLFKLPIDYWGNVHLCSKDWKNEYFVGNIRKEGLISVIEDTFYQNARGVAEKRLLDRKNCPNVCLTCPEPWIMLPHFWKEIRNKHFGTFTFAKENDKSKIK